MLRVRWLGSIEDEVDFKITRYVNDNLLEIISFLCDFIEDTEDRNVESILPEVHKRKTNESWTEMVYDLREMVLSDVIRDQVKPKYEFLLFEILHWWEEIYTDVGELLVVEMSEELANMIVESYGEEDGSCYVLDAITDYQEYYEFLFDDYDFLLDSVESLTSSYLRSSSQFDEFFSDVDLELYRNLMPRDLQEQYDERKNLCNKEVKIDLNYRLYGDVLYSCERIQANRALHRLQEDELNDYLRDLLDAREYTVRDQTRQGISLNGQGSGEIDILVRSGRTPISIIEALKVTCVDEKNISEHISKIYRYDTLGYRYNFLLLYVYVKDFVVFWDRFQRYVLNCKYPHKMVGHFEDKSKQYPELRTMEVVLRRNGIDTKLYFVAVHMLTTFKTIEK